VDAGALEALEAGALAAVVAVAAPVSALEFCKSVGIKLKQKYVGIVPFRDP